MNVDIVLTKPQRQFIFSEAPHPAIVGGLGSGKSQAGTFRLILLMLGDPGANGAYYMPTYDLINLRAIPGAEADLNNLGLQFKTNKSSYSIDVFGYGTIIFRSYDRPERIIAYEVAHSICDELDTLPKDKAGIVWRKISERNRQKREGENTIGLVTTPDQGVNGFVYEKWVKRKQSGYVLYKASTYSNPFLPADYAENIKANYDPILAELYLEGEFVSLNQNKVYHFFTRVNHHSARVITEQDTVLHIGLDFNIGGCCAVAFVIDGNNPIAVDEFTSYDTRDFVNNLTRYKGKKLIIYPDASGAASHTNASQSDISIIKAAGFQVNYFSQNPAIRDRINAYNGLLAHGRLRVNTDKCPNLANALETQGYDQRGDPEKWNDHPSIDDWCFSGDTEIVVNGIKLEFRNVPESGMVRGFEGIDVPFFNAGVKGHEKLFAIKLNNGKIIKATKDHCFLTLNGWVSAEHLTGESLCSTELYRTACKSSTAENFISGLMGIFTKRLAALRPEKRAGREIAFTGVYGNQLWEKYLLALLFIIKMKTKVTMQLAISKLCQKANTINSILSSGINLTLSTQGYPSQNHKISAGNGTNQAQEIYGTNSITKTLKNYFIESLQTNARNVQRSTRQKTREEINSAQETVKHKRAEMAALITKKGYALSANKNSKPINTLLQNTVVESVEELAESQNVYCLSTADGCFSLADGEIVANCDSSGYFIAHKFPIGRAAMQSNIGGIL